MSQNLLLMTGFAFLTGILIGLSRVVNSRLAMSTGAVASSVWNHIVGFLFLIGIVTLSGQWTLISALSNVPSYLFLGGVIGGCFVALNSWVIPRIGAMPSALLVIAGEMLTSVWLDWLSGNLVSISVALVGVVLIVGGIKCAQMGTRA